MRGRAAGAASGAGAGASSVVMARECSRRASPGGRSRRVRYHSADVATRPAPVMSGARLRIGVLGAGTVGREVVRALLDRPDELRAADGAALGVGRRRRPRRGPGRRRRAARRACSPTRPAHLVADEEIDVIVELMGGDEPAHTLIAAALSMGKGVVTANKHVIAHHGPELEAIARRTGAALRFEAAVGGGIPVLGPLAADLAANRVQRVRGIVNGTTNFILSAMTDEANPLDYAAALAEAQRLGYAEADPSGDIEGLDAVNKLVILARLAFDALARPGGHPDASRGRGRAGRPGHHDGQPRRPGRRRGRPGGSSACSRPRRPTTTAAVSAAVLPTALPRDSALGRTRACATGSRSTRRRSGGSASTVRARAVRRRRRRSSATSSRSAARRDRPGAAAAGGERLGPARRIERRRGGAFLETAGGIRVSDR